MIRQQMKLIGTAPTRRPGPAGKVNIVAFVVVDARMFRDSTAAEYEMVTDYVIAGLADHGADPDLVVWSAEPVGPQLRLATVDGIRQ